jgi:hypothetical protein
MTLRRKVDVGIRMIISVNASRTLRIRAWPAALRAASKSLLPQRRATIADALIETASNRPSVVHISVPLRPTAASAAGSFSQPMRTASTR